MKILGTRRPRPGGPQDTGFPAEKWQKLLESLRLLSFPLGAQLRSSARGSHYGGPSPSLVEASGCRNGLSSSPRVIFGLLETELGLLAPSVPVFNAHTLLLDTQP